MPAAELCVGCWLADGRGKGDKGRLADSLTSRRRGRSRWLIGETRDDETRLIGWLRVFENLGFTVSRAVMCACVMM